MKYRLIIFDFDGTLADSFPWFVTAVNEAADTFGFRRVEPQEVEALRGCDARQVMAHVGLPVWKLPRVARYLRRSMAASRARVRLFDGAARALASLVERGVETAIVSSNSAENIRHILGAEGTPLVRHYACGAALFGKSLKFRRLLTACGVAPGEALYIGDEIRDAEAAARAGIAFAGVAWGYTSPEALQALCPRPLLRTWDEVADAAG